MTKGSPSSGSSAARSHSGGFGLWGAAPAAASFARANVALYIEAVYSAHLTLSQIRKALLAAYHKLGGPAAFGASLSDQEVQALARAYSEPADRLYPHVAVHLAS